MGFILRLCEEGSRVPLLIGRVPSARDALALMRRWREQHAGTWVEVVQPERRPSGDAA